MKNTPPEAKQLAEVINIHIGNKENIIRTGVQAGLSVDDSVKDYLATLERLSKCLADIINRNEDRRNS
jgi:hypothetical protein